MIKVDTSNSLLDDAIFDELEQKLQPEIEVMRAVVAAGGYADDRASLNLVDDTEMIATLKRAAEPFVGAYTILLIGMGGPGLGAKAVQEAIQGTLNNSLLSAQSSSSARVFYLDTIDPKRVAMLTQILEAHLAEHKKIVILVATQSGTTTETVANLEHFLTFLQQHTVDPVGSLAIITNEGSKLQKFAHDLKLTTVLVPPIIGGRYSVFSPLGLFPLLVMGLDVDELIAGAKRARDASLSTTFSQNPAAHSAAVIAHHHQAGRSILTNLMLTPDYESVGYWCRQIMAESLGKKHNRTGDVVNTGITPTIEVSSRDLHSMFQLHMEGPDDTLTRFVRVKATAEVTLPKREEYDRLVPALQGRTYAELTTAIADGVLYAYRGAGRPYTVTDLDGSMVDLGAFLQTVMMETMFLGHLMNVNPFDQTGVELYKTEMKRILANG